MNKDRIRHILLKNIAPLVILILIFFGVERETAEEIAPIIEDVVQEIEMSSTSTVTVTKVYDGDTFTISSGKRVRLIGIDAPEIGEPFADESKNLLTSLILGKQVRLEIDESETDKYDRLLRYVYVDDDFVNKRMIEAGLAQSLYIKPDISNYQELLAAEEQAQQLGIGMWEN